MSGDHDPADGDHEVDDQFRALLEGLRTSLPGVQVLFAFLLVLPLQTSFGDLGTVERVAFAIAFYGSGVASILLITPSVHQRVRAPMTGLRRHSKRHLLIATWLGIAGTLAMGIAMLATAFLVSQIAFPSSVAATSTVLLGALLTWAWFYLPIVTFRASAADRD
jgi:hypothetical protein